MTILHKYCYGNINAMQEVLGSIPEQSRTGEIFTSGTFSPHSFDE